MDTEEPANTPVDLQKSTNTLTAQENSTQQATETPVKQEKSTDNFVYINQSGILYYEPSIELKNGILYGKIKKVASKTSKSDLPTAAIIYEFQTGYFIEKSKVLLGRVIGMLKPLKAGVHLEIIFCTGDAKSCKIDSIRASVTGLEFKEGNLDPWIKQAFQQYCDENKVIPPTSTEDETSGDDVQLVEEQFSTPKITTSRKKLSETKIIPNAVGKRGRGRETTLAKESTVKKAKHDNKQKKDVGIEEENILDDSLHSKMEVKLDLLTERQIEFASNLQSKLNALEKTLEEITKHIKVIEETTQMLEKRVIQVGQSITSIPQPVSNTYRQTLPQSSGIPHSSMLPSTQQFAIHPQPTSINRSTNTWNTPTLPNFQPTSNQPMYTQEQVNSFITMYTQMLNGNTQ